MNMQVSMQAIPQMDHHISPTLVAFAQILQLDGAQMQQAVRQELEQNPALELVERELCMFCGQPLRRGICYDCLRREAHEPADDGYRAPVSDDDFDLMSSVAAPRSLAEVMIEALVLGLAREDLFIGEYLVGCLDERAFLPEHILNEVVRTLSVTPERARRVLETLQHSGPPGLGARSARECLLLQLEHLEARGEGHPLARRIVEEHLEDLARRKYRELARRLGVTVEAVASARDFIRKRLRPFVVTGDDATEIWESADDRMAVIPDIVIRPNVAQAGEFLVEVAESRRYALRVSATYRRLAQSLDGDAPAAGLAAEDCVHILAQVARAQQFIGHLRERESTLRRVAQAVVERQKAYLRSGVRHLAPLTRVQIATALGLHESTISRAVADKYVLLPWRETTAFSRFFEAARAAQDVLRELVAGEPEARTDDELARLLAGRGYPLARRTVAKYRSRMGMLPSTLR